MAMQGNFQTQLLHDLSSKCTPNILPMPRCFCPLLTPSKFSEHCWCSDNWISIHLASLKSDILLPLHRRMFGQVIWDTPLKLKSKSNKDESNYFEWLCTHVPFSCFLSGFYRAYDTIVIAVIVRSCLSCDDHYHQSGNQALTR